MPRALYLSLHNNIMNPVACACAEMSAQQLMERGRKEMKAQDESLLRAQKIVESTVEIGSKTAETLHAQGQQMERVLDNLEEMRFDIKKGGQVIRDITRGLATDKCAALLSFFAPLFKIPLGALVFQN